jgi:hypothetical protein
MGLAFIVLGVLLLVVAGAYTATQRSFQADAQHTDGTVVSLNAGPAHPNIEFTTPSGARVLFSDNGWISYRVHDHVTVLFDPEDAERSARIDDPGALWYGPCLAAGLGIAALLMGGLSLSRFGDRLTFNRGES